MICYVFKSEHMCWKMNVKYIQESTSILNTNINIYTDISAHTTSQFLAYSSTAEECALLVDYMYHKSVTSDKAESTFV